MMNFLLDLVVPFFQVVGGVGSLGLVVVPRYNDRVYWRFSIPACPATGNTHEGHPVKFGLPHNHPANQSKIEVMKVKTTSYL
jgi:hypothetical protein